MRALAADGRIAPTFAARLAETLVEARKAVGHTPECVARRDAFKLIVGLDSTVSLCACDRAVRLEEKLIEGLVAEIGAAFGQAAIDALAAEPWCKQRIAELEAQLADVHHRALT